MDTQSKEAPRYAMYLRKSRADLELEAMGEEETLARHKAMLEALAAKHEIHPDQITIYHELVSGDSIGERPEMQRLLADVYAKTYKGVLVVEVERLARGNTRDQGEVADAFQASNTHIITPAKTMTRTTNLTRNTLNSACLCLAGSTKPSSADWKPGKSNLSWKEITSCRSVFSAMILFGHQKKTGLWKSGPMKQNMYK